MDFYETVGKRHSVREFKKGDIDDKALLRILETANLAPSAGNLQAYKIYMVKNEDAKQALADAALEQEFLAGAPIVLVFVACQKKASAKYGDRGAGLYCIQDATIAAAYAQLAATSEKLGSAWVGAFDPLEVARVIDAESYEVPVVLVPIGKPAKAGEASPRLTLEKLVIEV